MTTSLELRTQAWAAGAPVKPNTDAFTTRPSGPAQISFLDNM